MKLTTRQQEVLTDLATKTFPVKIGMHTGYREDTAQRLADVGLVTLERRAHEERRPGCSVASWVSDGTWASITDAGRAAVKP